MPARPRAPKKHRVVFRPQAEADLFELYRYIAEESGSARAGQYIARIEQACFALETLPLRGMRRDDIRPGIRTLGFERRATIVFRVEKSEVRIVRIFYGGRDLDRRLQRDTDDRSDEEGPT
jgi:toxin ParE1/3/4